mgnify:CR=1 FL=1
MWDKIQSENHSPETEPMTFRWTTNNAVAQDLFKYNNAAQIGKELSTVTITLLWLN